MVDKSKIKPNSDSWIEKIGAGSGSKTEKQINEIGNQLNRFLEEQVKAFSKKMPIFKVAIH